MQILRVFAVALTFSYFCRPLCWSCVQGKRALWNLRRSRRVRARCHCSMLGFWWPALHNVWRLEFLFSRNLLIRSCQYHRFVIKVTVSFSVCSVCLRFNITDNIVESQVLINNGVSEGLWSSPSIHFPSKLEPSWLWARDRVQPGLLAQMTNHYSQTSVF